MYSGSKIVNCELVNLEYSKNQEDSDLDSDEEFEGLELGKTEMAMCALNKPTVTIKNSCGGSYSKTYDAPNGKYFTTRQLLKAIEKY